MVLQTPTSTTVVAPRTAAPRAPVKDAAAEAVALLRQLETELTRAGIRAQPDFVKNYGKAEHLSHLVALQAGCQVAAQRGRAPAELGAWIQAAIDKINSEGLVFADLRQATAQLVRSETTELNVGLLQSLPSLPVGDTELQGHMRELTTLVGAFLKATGAGQQASAAGATELAGRWADYVAQHKTAFGGADVNALVQAVLRDAYMENTKDLMFFAEKVKWFNKVKKQVRDELTRARKMLAQVAGLDPDDPLLHLFFGKMINTTYSGPDTQIILDSATEALIGQVDGKQLVFTPDFFKTEGVWDAIVALSKLQLKPEEYGTRSCTGSTNGSSVVNSFYYFLALHDLVEGHPDNYPAGQLTEDLKSQYGIDAALGDDGTLAVTMPDGTRFVDTSGNGAMGEADLNFGKALTDMANAIGLEGYSLSEGFDELKTNQFRESMAAFMADTGSEYPREHMAALFTMAYMFVDAGKATAEVGTGKPIGTKEGLETYIKNTEEVLNSVGDDAQLANVDLQNMLQKQQQTLQMMSNISKMLHDTSMAVIRKIGS